jgi:hypothetical protein
MGMRGFWELKIPRGNLCCDAQAGLVGEFFISRVLGFINVLWIWGFTLPVRSFSEGGSMIGGVLGASSRKLGGWFRKATLQPRNKFRGNLKLAPMLSGRGGVSG